MQCKLFGQARKLVNESPEPDLVSWSALISGYAQNGFGKEAILAFYEMHLLGVKCNEFTFSSVLKACIFIKDLELGRQVHGVVAVSIEYMPRHHHQFSIFYHHQFSRFQLQLSTSATL
ncbi:hypothetical protein REPUB_Repub13aG0241400 [Reevesia pubescens]